MTLPLIISQKKLSVMKKTNMFLGIYGAIHCVLLCHINISKYLISRPITLQKCVWVFGKKNIRFELTRAQIRGFTKWLYVYTKSLVSKAQHLFWPNLLQTYILSIYVNISELILFFYLNKSVLTLQKTVIQRFRSSLYQKQPVEGSSKKWYTSYPQQLYP